MTRRRLPWALLVAVGVLISVGVPIAWVSTRAPDTVGADVAEALAEATPAPTSAAVTAAPGTTAAPVPAVPTQDGRVGAAGSRAEAAPVEVRLPSIGVRSEIRPIGVERDGKLEIPEDVATVGWYRFGPKPGDARGSTVLSGHIDSAEQGRGAFFRLGDLRPGDPVVLRSSDGREWRYRVVAREEWPKTEVPLDRIFARSGAARLTLVTCGGGFREDVRSYTDNIAVTAVPQGAP